MSEIKDKISKVESGNNYKAVNKASNATGKYQFVRSTWEGLGYNWADRFDANLQEEAMAKLTSLNKNAFVSKFKTEPTDSDLYGMHFLGTAGYSKVKQASPNTPISELIKGQAYNLNKNVFEKNGRPITVSEFNGWLTKKMGTGVSKVDAQTTPQEQPQAGYVGMLPNGLPDVYGQPYVAEEETKTETAEAPKRTDNANKLGFVADYEELSKQYEQQLQAQQNPIIQQEIVEGVQYQPIQQNFQEGGYFFQKGGTWEKQQARVKAEKDAKLKALLAQEKPVYKKKTVDEKLAEKRAQENTKTVQKDSTNVRGYNNAEKFSKTARNKTDKEVAEERQSRIDAQAKANEQPFDWSNFRQSLADRSQATGDALRVSNEPNFFDDYLNPAVMIGSMADNLGQAPLRAQQEDSYMPYVTAVGTPLTVGAMAGIGTQNTGQFVNNLANPLAGTGDLVNNLGNKYLPNTYKLNPLAFKPNPEMGYRMLGKEGFQDAMESGVLRAKPIPNQAPSGGISLSRNTNRNPNTGKMQGALDRPYFADGFIDNRYAADYMAEVNKLENDLVPIPTHKGIAPSQPGSIPLENATLYKKDWLKGYKQVEVPKTAQDFKSEIDWSKWNKEIPDNPQLMKEYNAIEQTSKANNTWMKNPDGSAFQGTPEQFVQQNSENFKKAFPDYYGSKLHHRSKNEFNTFDENKFGSTDYGYHGKGIYASEDAYRTARYGDKPYELYVNTKNKGVNPDYNEFYRKDLSESLNTLEKNYLQQKSLPEDFPEHYPNLKEYNNNLDINFEKDINGLIKNKKQLDDYDLVKVGNEVVIPFNNPVKSAIGNNGMFDMSNPNIYKAAVPIGLGASYLGTQEQQAPKYQLGGIKIDPQGYWNPNNEGNPVIIEDQEGQRKYPNKITKIKGNIMSTEGYGDIPLYVIPNVGEPKLILPNTGTHFFPKATDFIEYPIKIKDGK